jgi:hypothetical protein
MIKPPNPTLRLAAAPSTAGRAFAAVGTFEETFGIYENTRKERANGVQLASRQQANETKCGTERAPNLGAGAEMQGRYSYNLLTVPLAPAGQHASSSNWSFVHARLIFSNSSVLGFGVTLG